MRLISLILALGLSVAGCKASADTVKYPNGTVYKVERVTGIEADDLPLNNDLRMANGDLGSYAQALCALDVPLHQSPTRCDIYAQSNSTGSLIGYAIVTQATDGLTLATATTVNEHKEPSGASCWIGGNLYDAKTNYETLVRIADQDFEARIMYSAWEKQPGNFVVSQVDTDSNVDVHPEGAIGVWYIIREGNKLRVSQERWNYCYRDYRVNVDDVFYRVISLTKLAD